MTITRRQFGGIIAASLVVAATVRPSRDRITERWESPSGAAYCEWTHDMDTPHLDTMRASFKADGMRCVRFGTA